MLTGDLAGGLFGILEFGVQPWEDPELYRRLSPLTYAPNIRTPLLIQHAENDLRCPIGQAEALFAVLRTLGRPVRLMRVPGETHELTRSGTPFRRVENLVQVRVLVPPLPGGGQATPAAVAGQPGREVEGGVATWTARGAGGSGIEGAPAPIPRLRVAGDHRTVGRGIGAATAPVLRAAVAFDAALPAGVSREAQLALAARYRAATLAATPWLVAEIDGAAEGAGVDPLALFAASVEEIWPELPSAVGTPDPATGAPGPGAGATAGPTAGTGGCTDLVIGPPHTADGHTWVAHTNDLDAASEADLVAVEWRVPGEPVVFSVGIGPWISVGWNDAGLSLTGNEVSPNDMRVGVPRLLMVREQLAARSLDEAIALALRPDRASSYNTVLADRSGAVANVEGSATRAVVRRLARGEPLAHANHYVEPAMVAFEGDPAYAVHSAARFRRGCALLAGAVEATASSGGERVTPAVLRAWLADHDGAPDSICRHGPGEVEAAGGEAPDRSRDAARAGARRPDDANRVLVHRRCHGRRGDVRPRQPLPGWRRRRRPLRVSGVPADRDEGTASA